MEFMPHLALLSPVETKVITSESYRELKSQNEALKERITVIESQKAKADAKADARAPGDNKLNKIFEAANADPEDLKLMMELLKRLKDKGVV